MMVKTTKKPTESPFQIETVSVLKLHIDNTFIEYSERIPAEKLYDVSYSVKDVKKTADTTGWQGILDLATTLTCHSEAGQFALDLVVRGFFTTSDKQSKNEFEQLLKINGCSALYSVARGIISSVSAQVFSLGNVVLPLVNFVRFHEAVSDSKKKKS